MTLNHAILSGGYAARRFVFSGTLLLAGIGCAASTEPAPSGNPDLQTGADALQATVAAATAVAPPEAGAAPLPPCPEAPTTYSAHKDLAYGADDAHKLDVFVPAGAGPFPLAIFVHGGGWVGGDKAGALILPLAKQGYVVASINYRFSDVAKFPAQIHDVKAAIRWLRANAATYKIDAGRVAIAGGSAGAHLAALAGTSGNVPQMEDLSMGNRSQSSVVQAVVDLAGPTDFSQMDALPSPNCLDPKPHDVATSGVSKLVGCVISTCPVIVQRANPIRYITADDPPFFIMHGDADCTVPLSQSQLLTRALRAAQVPAKLVVLPDAEHMGPEFKTATSQALIQQFLDTRLKRCR